MLAKWDDYLIHQTSDQIEVVASPELKWFERFNFWVHLPGPGPLMGVGLDCFPNAKVMSAFVILNCDDVQYNFRASREVRGDRTETRVGPLSFDILVPMQSWRIRLEANSHTPISFDLESMGRTPAYGSQREYGAQRGAGEAVPQQWHSFQQALCYKGRLDVAGKTYESSSFVGSRVRGWGHRSDDMGLALLEVVWAHFTGYSIYVAYGEDVQGNVLRKEGGVFTDKGKMVEFADIKPRITFQQGTRELTTLAFDLRLADGGHGTLSGKPVSSAANYRGTWGAKAKHEPLGPLHLEAEQWDLKDADALSSLGKWTKEVVYEVDWNGEKGSAWVEYMVSKRHAKYGAAL